MATKQHLVRSLGLAVQPDLPLIGGILPENRQEMVRYFADEAETDSAIASLMTTDARSTAAAWAGLDRDEAIDARDRIRHGNVPKPPIDTI